MRIRHTSQGTLHDFPDIDLDREMGMFQYSGRALGGFLGHHNLGPTVEPYRLPDQICQTCFDTKFGELLANTYCFDAEWIILGHDDVTGTKNPPDWRREAGLLTLEERRIPPVDPPRIMWARGMWGIQIRYYKDTNA